MNREYQTYLIERLIKENPDYVISDYLELINEFIEIRSMTYKYPLIKKQLTIEESQTIPNKG